MSIANPEKVCYRHLQILKKGKIKPEELVHYFCNGSRSSDSSCPCDSFLSTEAVYRAFSQGLYVLEDIEDGWKNERCAFELMARIGHINPYVKNRGKNCVSCNSNSNSGKSCDFYVDFKDFSRSICAFQVRAKRLVDKFGSKELLRPAELFCLDECHGTIHTAACEQKVGYYDVTYVVQGICADKAKVTTKIRRGQKLEELETRCIACSGKIDCKLCPSNSPLATEVYGITVENALPPVLMNA